MKGPIHRLGGCIMRERRMSISFRIGSGGAARGSRYCGTRRSERFVTLESKKQFKEERVKIE